jgi:hypothetical protein
MHSTEPPEFVSPIVDCVTVDKDPNVEHSGMGDTLRSIVHAVSRLLRVPIAAIIRKEDAGSLPVAVGTEASPPIDPEDARLLLRAVRGSNDVIRISDAVRD